MKTLRWSVRGGWLLVALGAPALHAAETAAVNGAEPAGRVHALAITVVDAATKAPVAGATITCAESRDVGPATTDAAGSVTLRIPLDVPMADQQQRFDVGVTDPRYVQRRVMWIATAGGVRATLPAARRVELEPGIVAGGVIRDEHGTPVAGAQLQIYGSNYTGFRLGGDERSVQEFSQFNPTEAQSPVTDAKGEWRAERFPADLKRLSIEVVRPGGARTRFVAAEPEGMPRPGDVSFEMDDLKAGKLVLTLADGQTLRGIVVSPTGEPVAGAQLRARDAGTRNRAYEFASGPDGKFELPHWAAANVMVTAEHDGFQATTVTIPVSSDAGAARIVLNPASPLRLRIVGDGSTPISGVKVRIDPNPSTDHILNWSGTTDGEGKVSWDTAPAIPVTLWLEPPTKEYPFRSLKVVADGTEHIVRYRKGDGMQVGVHLRVIDAESGAAVSKFEVWRRVANTPFTVWGSPEKPGEFSKSVQLAELPKGFVPSYRLQVRAAGYTGWASDALDFSEGDQELTVKLTKGVSNLTDNPLPRRPGMGRSGETNKELLVAGGNIAQFLESLDVAALSKAFVETPEDWAAIVPKGITLAESPLGPNQDRILNQRRKEVVASLEHVADIARRAGISAGAVRFTVKLVTTADTASRVMQLGGRRVMVPHATAVRVVLAGEPVGSAPAALRGAYELSIGDAKQLPGGWRAEKGVRWVSLPPGVGDAAVRAELQLANVAASTSLADRRTLSGMDDNALVALGDAVSALLRDGAVPAYLGRVTLSESDQISFYQRFGWGSAERARESHTKIQNELGVAAAAMVNLQRQTGLDFSDASVAVKQVLASNPSFHRFGEVDGLRAGPVQVVLTVASKRPATSGSATSGEYVVSLGDIVRVDGRWIVMGEKMRWQAFPDGLLTAEQAKAVEFENYVADHMAMPPGHAVPNIEFSWLADNTRQSLASYRGKVVVLEFWATWCGPCQEPMEKLQHLREAHPDWQDRVEVIAISIDDKAKLASDHLAKKEWTKTSNAWAGEGGWESPVAKQFRIRGVPTAYVLDREGKVVKAGHPMSMDFGAIVDAELRR